MSKNDSRLYSYYFDRFAIKLYDPKEKELCLRDYVIYMLDRTQKMFEYTGLPDTIPQRMLEQQLQVNGFSCITKVKGDLYAFWGGLGGEPDAYYRPTLCVVANPALKFNKSLKIDEECVIVRNDSYLYGLLPLFRRYATAMVENDVSFRTATINTRIQALLSAPDDQTRDAALEYLKGVEDGNLGVIASNEFLEGIKAQPVQGSMRTFTDLIEYQQYLKASWFNEIGLNANYNMKREKLSTTESQMNSDALLPLVDDMLEQRKLGVEQINEMFGTNITVEFSSSWLKLVEELQSNQLDSEVSEDDTENYPEGDSGGMSGNVQSESESDGEELREDETEHVSVDASESEVSGEGTPEGNDDEPSESDEGDDVQRVEVIVDVNVNTEEGEINADDDVPEETESDGSVSERDRD